MFSEVPTLVRDVGVIAAAVVSTIAAFTAVAALGVKGLRFVINQEVPRAVEKAVPEVTQEQMREAALHAIEPYAALLHAELSGVRAEMRPNGGSSMFDVVNRRIDTIEGRLGTQDAKLESIQAGQRKLFVGLSNLVDDDSGES